MHFALHARTQSFVRILGKVLEGTGPLTEEKRKNKLTTQIQLQLVHLYRGNKKAINGGRTKLFKKSGRRSQRSARIRAWWKSLEKVS